ncbi:MAG TPA: hypothetical protein VMW16_10565 [Sedimentisphaerales bacterium]|nr:hypothetical protein [Sedimentisphaerales bacterium]
MDDPSDVLIAVQARVEDAGVLADNGRYEGAMLMLLTAVAATSRKRYPRGTPSKKNPRKPMSDREAFTTFLRDEIWRLVREHEDFVVYHGEKKPIEEFLYEYLRCELVHEGRTPVDLYPMREGDVLTIDYPDGSGITFSRLLLARLNDVVWRAPENSYEATKAEIEAIRRRRAKHRLERTRDLSG